jgi:hypothetical protein
MSAPRRHDLGEWEALRGSVPDSALQAAHDAFMRAIHSSQYGPDDESPWIAGIKVLLDQQLRAVRDLVRKDRRTVRMDALEHALAAPTEPPTASEDPP